MAERKEQDKKYRYKESGLMPAAKQSEKKRPEQDGKEKQDDDGGNNLVKGNNPGIV